MEIANIVKYIKTLKAFITWCAKQLTPPNKKPSTKSDVQQILLYNSPKLSNKQQKLLDKCQKLSNKSSNVVQQTANLLYNNQKLSNKLSNKSENCPTNCRQLYNKWQLSNKWEKLSNKIWKTVQQTPSVGQFLSKMLYNKPDFGDLLYNRRLSVGKLYNRFLSA